MKVHSPATYLYDYILTADTRVLFSLRLPPYNLAEPVEGHNRRRSVVDASFALVAPQQTKL